MYWLLWSYTTSVTISQRKALPNVSSHCDSKLWQEENRKEQISLMLLNSQKEGISVSVLAFAILCSTLFISKHKDGLSYTGYTMCHLYLHDFSFVSLPCMIKICLCFLGDIKQNWNCPCITSILQKKKVETEQWIT